MREEPLLLVLDEPTANLDAQTEYTLFERYALAARQVARVTGGITILVSHRFSTVRMADRIVVLDKGRLAEIGSHGELDGHGGCMRRPSRRKRVLVMRSTVDADGKPRPATRSSKRNSGEPRGGRAWTSMWKTAAIMATVDTS